MKAAAFRQWIEEAQWQAAMRGRLRKATGRMRNFAMTAAFIGWTKYAKKVKAQSTATHIDQLQVCSQTRMSGRDCARLVRVVTVTMFHTHRQFPEAIASMHLQADCDTLRQENDRMRRDNERFVRIIDSGEWGRGRVAELVQAGQILKQERDQLRKLMGHLRSDYEAVERAKVVQQEELMALKSRMRKKGAANNKMLVKVHCRCHPVSWWSASCCMPGNPTCQH
jgi:hypothetical protein